jgi:H+/Cl- antiporter ClcA
MDEGKIDYEPIPGGLLKSIVSLVGGFSLGPEVPTGMLAGGSATAIAKGSKWDDSTQKVTFDAAVGDAYGGLFTSPFVMTLMILELSPPERLKYFSYLTIQVFAALIGFAVFFAIGGFSDLLSELSLPLYNLELWHFGIAVAIGYIGMACAPHAAVLI